MANLTRPIIVPDLIISPNQFGVRKHDGTMPKEVGTPKIIVVHSNGVQNQRASAIKSWFQNCDPNNPDYRDGRGNLINTSAHFAIDTDDGKNTIYRYLDDNIIGYHCGGVQTEFFKGLVKKMGLQNLSQNCYTIGIEVCEAMCPKDWLEESKLHNNTSKNKTPGIMSGSGATKCRELLRYLMNLYNIQLDCVVRHFDVTGKTCPAYMHGKRRMTSERWNNFKSLI